MDVHPLFDTLDTILAGQVPNLLRLYLNPAVAQTCLCLSRYVQETWHEPAEYQSFLANSFDEALSGAIKLARYATGENGPRTGLVIDPDGRLGPLASVTMQNGEKIEFIPDLQSSVPPLPRSGREGRRFAFVVLVPSDGEWSIPDLSGLGEPGKAPLLIVCVTREAIHRCRKQPSGQWAKLRPDIVVFDESFVNGHVPFAAFAARKELYDHWNQRKTATFHSTTFQPNTISALHFLRCTERDDPEFFAQMAPELKRIADDPAHCKALFAKLYSPSLARAIATVGWDRSEVRAAGHYLSVDGRPVFDGVAGVACSIRGHNPAGYREEIQKLDDMADYHQTATRRLHQLTGLEHMLPAVSGASAVENALRLALAAQYPRKYVLALKGGFGGKTLLALTGTANPSYKARIDPLYPHVVYVDPFRDSAIDDLEAAFAQVPVGVVQLELIQAVGGVRPVPDRVVQYLQAQKGRHGYLLFVDEVQTGMYRTGPFLRSQQLGITPDLVTIGKGVSDMMFPFAVTLFSDAVQEKLAGKHPALPEMIRRRHDYEFGYKTLLNVLNQAEELGLSERGAEQGTQFRQILTDQLASCRAVRDVRVFGLLIAIELETRNWPRKWYRKQAGALYVLSMLRHQPFPVFMGYCQYEPHVLKLTPPLTITNEEVEKVCETVASVLHRPPHQFLPPLLGALARSYFQGKWEAYRNRRSAHECAAR